VLISAINVISVLFQDDHCGLRIGITWNKIQIYCHYNNPRRGFWIDFSASWRCLRN